MPKLRQWITEADYLPTEKEWKSNVNTLPCIPFTGIEFIIPVEPVCRPKPLKIDRVNNNPLHPNPLKRQRKSVYNYLTYKENVNKHITPKLRALLDKTHILNICFVQRMPTEWIRKKPKKRDALAGTYCTTSPDKESLLSAFIHAVFDKEHFIADGRVAQIWGYKGMIKIYFDKV